MVLRDTDELLREIVREPRGSSRPADHRIGERIGPFEITGKLGQGGMGVVYAAEDTRLGRAVALKLLLPELVHDPHRRARFLREARTGSAVLHPRLATVFQVGEHDDTVFIAMELIRGGTLRERLDARGALPVREAVELAIAIAEGVAATHRKGIVHRDLKPENVMLTEAGDVKVLDFGLAKPLHEAEAGAARALPSPDRADDAPPLSRASQVMGTPQYMAPEQAAGRPVDARADVYAMGVMLAEIVDGQRPGDVPATPDAARAGSPPPALTRAPVELRAVIERCRAERPEDRFADCDALFEALLRVRHALIRGPRIRRAVAAATLLLVVAAGFVLHRQAAAACAVDGDCPSGRCSSGACEPWSATLAGPPYGSLDAVVLTAADELVLGGQFDGATDYGCGRLETAEQAVLVFKYTAAGACAWARAHDVALHLLGIAPTADGHFIASMTGGKPLEDPDGVRDAAVVMELDADGREVWQRRSRGEHFGWSPMVDARDRPVLVGGSREEGRPFLRITRLDRRGEVESRHELAGDEGSAVVVHWSTLDRAGDVVVYGALKGGFRRLDPSLVSRGGHDPYVAKLSGVDGTPRWARRLGSSADEPQEGAVITDAAGDVFVVGELAGADLGGGPLPGTVFVAKLAGADGAHLWSRGFGGSVPRDGARRVTLDPSTGDPLVFGRSLSPTIAFDDLELVSATGSGLFVLRLSGRDGRARALRAFETSNATARAIAFSPRSHNVVVAGRFEGAVTFGGRRHTTPTHDGFFASLGVVE